MSEMVFRAVIKTASGKRAYYFRSEATFRRRYTKSGRPRAATARRLEERRERKKGAVYRVTFSIYPEEYGGADYVSFRAWAFISSAAMQEEAEERLSDYLSVALAKTPLFFAARRGSLNFKKGVETQKISKRDMIGGEFGRIYAKARLTSKGGGRVYEYDKPAIDAWRFHEKTRSREGRIGKMRSLLEW